MKIKMLLFFLLLGGIVSAQERSAAVEQAVQEQTARYNLSAEQIVQMYVVEERRERNLQEIEVLRESNYRLYLEKKQSVRKNSEGTIRQILHKEQRFILDQEQAAYRQATSNLIQQMRQDGKSKEDIELALLERS
ncbi:hypothetical protein [Lewinella cohaerens]|uniref:hypothetical protein n=1 Tax=Lewinella cohaerens TaxID=70995 RepID=UPI0005C7994E|nr:hypothetical protein [Lewinella cohaerens]